MKSASGWVVRAGMLVFLSLGAQLSTPLKAQEVFALPEGKVGVAYEFHIQTGGGLEPLQWKVVQGELPPGIELLPSGTLRGVPASPRREPFQFTVEVSDSSQPPQSFAQRFSLLVSTAPLRILLGPSKLRIATPTEEERKSSSGALPRLEIEGEANNTRSAQIAREPSHTEEPESAESDPSHWPLPVNPPTLAARWPSRSADTMRTAEASPGVTMNKNQDLRTVQSTGPNFNPATFVRIYEDTKAGNRIQIYDATKSQAELATHFSADYESTIVIVPDPSLMGNDLPLNKLYMSAVLSSEDKNQNVEVTGYAEVGKDKTSMAAQRGMAFQTTENVKNMVINMAYTADDIIRSAYQLDPDRSVYDQEDQIKSESQEARQAQLAGSPSVLLQRAKDSFSLYRPEIQAISAFFADEQNLAIVQILGKEVFWVDSASLQQIAKQYQENMRVAFDPASTQSAKNDALQQLLERTHLVVEDFRDLILQARSEAQSQDCLSEKRIQALSLTPKDQRYLLRICGIEKVAKARRERAFGALKKLFAPGSISLRSAKAADGNLLTLTVEAVGTDGNSVGIPAKLEIAMKKYGTKIQWSPSLLFVRRLGVRDSEVTPPTGSTAAPLNRVNFAPSPGMTFGVAYFKRGESAGDKFWRAFGPGLGMNVSFMNFNDPSFDVATSKFVNTSGTNVQVGAGLIGSVFDNKLQFSYGWNLNVERRRNYFGVGFGFIEVGKELAKYIKP
jgi:hypothetical protein